MVNVIIHNIPNVNIIGEYNKMLMDLIDQRILEAKIKARDYARKHIKRVFYKRGEYAQVERMIINDGI